MPCLSHNTRLPSQEITSPASCELSRCRKAEFELLQPSVVTSFTLRCSDHTHFQEHRLLAEHSGVSNESHSCLSTSNLPIRSKAPVLFVGGSFHTTSQWRHQPDPAGSIPRTYHALLTVTLAPYQHPIPEPRRGAVGALLVSSAYFLHVTEKVSIELSKSCCFGEH